MWLSHPSFPGVVKDAWIAHPGLPTAVTTFTNKAKEWNNNILEMFSNKRKEFVPNSEVFNLPLPLTLVASLLILRKRFKLSIKRLLSKKRSSGV